jgi:hypothetical protein
MVQNTDLERPWNSILVIVFFGYPQNDSILGVAEQRLAKRVSVKRGILEDARQRRGWNTRGQRPTFSSPGLGRNKSALHVETLHERRVHLQPVFGLA